VRCSLGFPKEWPDFKLGAHVRRQVKHVLVHSERPLPMRAADEKSLGKLVDLLDYRYLEQEFAIPMRTRKGEVMGRRRLTPVEIGAAFDLPLVLTDVLAEEGLQSDFGSFALKGCPAKFLLEALRHVMDQLLGTVAPVTQAKLPVVPPTPLRIRATDGPMPKAEINLPPWARVCSDNAKATKSDDARPNLPMWDLRVAKECPHLTSESLSLFQNLIMPVWRRRHFWSFRRFMQMEYGVNWIQWLESLR